MKVVRDNFKKQEKRLKKYPCEQEIYEKIIRHIKQVKSYDELERHVISKLYGFEALKYELSGYYSFNLNKNSGKIRLIVSIDKENGIVEFVYISLEHYEDFKRKI